MKISLLMVATVDGVIAKDENHHTFSWNSKEDQLQFLNETTKIGTVIMGSKTYVSIGQKPLKDRLSIVLTRTPEKFRSLKDVIIKSGDPNEIVRDLEDMGITEAALIGGAKTNAEFIKAGLVDELYLTVEPKIFGSGMRISEGISSVIDLELIEYKQLNKKGTILLHYKFIKNIEKS